MTILTDEVLKFVVKLRREIHANPEIGFKEFNTQAKIIEILQTHGIAKESIKKCAGTGLVVDLWGKGSTVPEKKIVAFRGDIDALAMTENNPQLPYQSKNPNAAHMCGHDGHTAALVGFAIVAVGRLDKLPSNRCIRLLFQPAEEALGGAEVMIKEGCLEGVSEIYGFHNIPLFDIGTCHVKSGPMMSHVSTFTVDIMGKGGHGSKPDVCVDPVLCASQCNVALQR